MLVPADENKDILKIYEDLRNKTRDLTRSKPNNADKYDEK